MDCRIHIQYAKGIDISRVGRSLLALWNGANRPPLCHIPGSGRLVTATAASLSEALEFSKDHLAGLTLKHRRRNKDTDSVRLSFSEPGHESGPDDAGYCHICFYHDRVDRSEPGYAPADLIEIMAGLIAAGPVSEAYCLGGEPFEVGDFREVSRRATWVDTGNGILRSLWWLTLVPPGRVAPTLAELKLLGIEHTVAREIHDRGSVISLSPRYPGGSQVFHELLRRIRQISREEQVRGLVRDLETIPVFRLAGKSLEVRPFPFSASDATAGQTIVSDAAAVGPEQDVQYREIANSFAEGKTSGGGLACPDAFPRTALDLTPSSLGALAEYLLHLKEHLNGISAPELQRTLFAAGVYFGEVARTNASACFRWFETDHWTRKYPQLVPRLRGLNAANAALVSETEGVARPIDRVFEVFSVPAGSG